MLTHDMYCPSKNALQEMYAFTLACYKVGIHKIDLHLKMMSQPPWDDKLAPFYILHYTYGMDYTLEGKFTPGGYTMCTSS
jgi:hydroxyproline O-arabinosyltransferase